MQVIFIHVSSAVISGADKLSWQYGVMLLLWRGCSFAVQGFVFLAAVKMALPRTKDVSYLRYLFGRIWRVYLPYIVASLVFFGFFVYWHYMSSDIGELAKNLLTGSVSGHFYFVIFIMQFYLTAPLWKKLSKWMNSGTRIVLVLTVSLFVSEIFGQYFADFLYIINPKWIFPYSDRIFTTYLFFWTAGLAVGGHYDEAKENLTGNLIPVSIVFVFAALLAGFLDYMHFTERSYVYWLETAHYFYVMASILFVFTMAARFGKRLSVFLTKIDAASYQIYLWHPLALYFADNRAAVWGITSVYTRFAIRLVYTYLLTVAVCTLAVHLYNKIKHRHGH